MNVRDALYSRICCRAYKDLPVSREMVLAILEAATRAPSWANTQPWEVFVAGGDALERLRQACLADFEKGVPGAPDLPRPQNWPPALQRRIEELMAKRLDALAIARDNQAARQDLMRSNYRFFGAPVVIYLCMDRTLTPWSVFDLGAFAQSIMLAAKEQGLDTAPAVNLITYPGRIRAELEIPDQLSIILGIALGYGDAARPQGSFRSPRRPLSEIVRLKGF